MPLGYAGGLEELDVMRTCGNRTPGHIAASEYLTTPDSEMRGRRTLRAQYTAVQMSSPGGRGIAWRRAMNSLERYEHGERDRHNKQRNKSYAGGEGGCVSTGRRSCRERSWQPGSPNAVGHIARSASGGERRDGHDTHFHVWGRPAWGSLKDRKVGPWPTANGNRARGAYA